MELRTPPVKDPWPSRTSLASSARARPGLEKNWRRPAIVVAATTISAILMISLTVSQFILPHAYPLG